MKPVTTHRPHRGWTFVEMLVAISISAIFFGAAALVYSSVTVNSKRLARLVTVSVDTNSRRNYYGPSAANPRTYAAPNYGRATHAIRFRDMMLEDADTSTAIFCLPRKGLNTVRQEFLDYQGASSPGDMPVLDSPEAFRQYLVNLIPDAANTYNIPVTNVPAADVPNLTIFMLAPALDKRFFRLKAVYEIDLLPSNTAYRNSTYASARRYKNGSLTHYYDVFFEALDDRNNAFNLGLPRYTNHPNLHPMVVQFERSVRNTMDVDANRKRFMIAEQHPFYLIFLPDPAINPLRTPPPTTSAPAGSALSTYHHLTNRTSIVVTLPMFPSL